MTMKKVISFDLDGTLVDGEYGNAVWLEGIPEEYARKYGMTIDDARIAVKEQYDSVGENHLLWYDIDHWLQRFGLSVSVPRLLDRYAGRIRLLPHVEEVVRTLRGRHRLVIASNAARIFVEKELSHTGLADCFSHTVSATSDFGMVKKQKAFYRKLCSVLGVSPHEVVHVGDHMVFDVEVPLAVGIDAYHYNPEGNANGRVLCDFRELVDRL
jgi:putative hydrolase of the HAD superfamily